MIDKVNFENRILRKINEYLRNNVVFLATLTAALIFYFPFMFGNVKNAGFLYGGDSLGWYLPALIKTWTYFANYQFSGIDFSTFGGGSDFFLSPNFFYFHPAVILFGLLSPGDGVSLSAASDFLVTMLFAHSFLAAYFSAKLFQKYFEFGISEAIVLGLIFAFSSHMILTLGQPNYIFSIAVMPWVVFAVLNYSHQTSFRNLLLAIFPILLAVLGGYIPLAISGLFLSFLIALIQLYIYQESTDGQVHEFKVLGPCLPYLCAILILSPYLIAVFQFHQETAGAGFVSLFYSAHQLAEAPSSILRALSSNYHFTSPGAFFEFSPSWGPSVILLAAIFLFGNKLVDGLTIREWRLFKASLIIYFGSVLAIYGQYSPISDLVFYFIPQVGKMHIYQRFLLPAQLSFGVVVVLMLKAVVLSPRHLSTRLFVLTSIFLAFFAAFVVGGYPELAKNIGIDNFYIIELILGSLFGIALLMPGKKFIYFSLVVAMLMPALGRMYIFSEGGLAFQKQTLRQKSALDDAEKLRLNAYLKRFARDKVVLKYADLTPLWNAEGIESFPKVMPYYLPQNQLILSSYGGFTFYLSARKDYINMMPVLGGEVSLSPDWDWMANSGADFVVASQKDLNNGPLSEIYKKINHNDIFQVSKDVVIFPLGDHLKNYTLRKQQYFNNGVFAIRRPQQLSEHKNLALKSKAHQSGELGFGGASLAIDGNTDGDYAHGSVTHSESNKNAWLDIDLGSESYISSVRIWNRTDCCRERLKNYWIFISKEPFSKSDTAFDLRGKNGVASYSRLKTYENSIISVDNVLGRYIRVQLGGSENAEGNYLSLAEVEVNGSSNKDSAQLNDQTLESNVKVENFKFDKGQRISITLDALQPMRLDYLFFPNPRLKYYLNQKRIYLNERDGIYGVDLPAGHNDFEVVYVNWPMRVFICFYLTYISLLLYFTIFKSFKKSSFSKFMRKLTRD
ncbi:discoidin domain-containing protein [Flavobacterium sp.]|uniref:galactose-binding domain-containing protein n=1 Tax=Flavobacterium sp. TaxID=239 RepID=UPI0037C0FE21